MRWPYNEHFAMHRDRCCYYKEMPANSLGANRPEIRYWRVSGGSIFYFAMPVCHPLRWVFHPVRWR